MLCALTHAQLTDFPCGTIIPFFPSLSILVYPSQSFVIHDKRDRNFIVEFTIRNSCTAKIIIYQKNDSILV